MMRSENTTPVMAPKAATESWLKTLVKPFQLASSSLNTAIFATASYLLPMQVGAICFEVSTNDNTLSCVSSSMESALYKLLQDQCSAYQTGNSGWPNDDCARFFVETRHFGAGTFGGSVCDWSSHTYNDCVYNTLKTNVGNSYGTDVDILATTGIVIGGVAVLGAAITSGICLFRSYQRHATENNHTPQNVSINDTHQTIVTVEIDQDPVVEANENEPLVGRVAKGKF